MLSRTTTQMHAFSAHAPLPTYGPLKSTSLCSRRSLVTRKRPRGVANLHAVFIWSNEGLFGEDDLRNSSSGNDADVNPDSEEPVSEPDNITPEPGGSGDAVDDHPVYGKSWGDSEMSADSATEKGVGGETKEDDILLGEGGSARRLYAVLQTYSKGPEDVDGIRSRTSDEAADAFRRVVMGIFGSIPSDSFDIVINTERHGMSRLMQSSLMTGYALRNAEYRMMLSETLSSSGPSMPFSTSPAKDTPPLGALQDTIEPDYMRSVPRRGKIDLSAVTGSVRWWDGERDEKTEMNVEDYVKKLEAENELLKERLQATKLHESNSNRLLDYMRTLSAEKISSLQAHISVDALEAFKMTIKNVLGEFNATKVQISYSTSRDYMGQLAFWCLLVGYHVRNLEKKFEMTRILETPESLARHSHEREA